MVVDGNKLESGGACWHVAVDVEGYQFTTDMYPISLRGLDMGIQWLQSLRLVLCYWTRLTINFTVDGKTYHLPEIAAREVQPASVGTR